MPPVDPSWLAVPLAFPHETDESEDRESQRDEWTIVESETRKANRRTTGSLAKDYGVWLRKNTAVDVQVIDTPFGDTRPCPPRRLSNGLRNRQPTNRD